LVNRYSTSQQIATRARIILLADGQNHRQIARELDISRDMARTWRHRWLELQERELPPSERLQDERSGAPATLVWSKWLNCLRLPVLSPVITDELSAIGQKELADEMVKQCIVESISTSCGTTTSRGATQTTPDPLLVDSPDEEFDAKVSDITQLYMSAIERAKLGERTVCIDEMTGIQASNVLPQTYHYGLVKFNGESLSISVMEHKA